jgi:glycosyltransferase involved in cell wall biosynthesis
MIVRAVLPLAERLHALAPFDLVDAQFFYPDGPAAAKIAAALSLPLSIKARGADIHLWGGKAYARRQMLRAAEQAAGVLAVSEALKVDMARLGIPSGKITGHYTGLDRELFRPLDRGESRARLAAEFGIPTIGPLLATVGALIPRKGQQLVIRALARMPDAHLALVGTGSDQTALEILVRESGMAGRVHFLGSLDHELLPIVLSGAEAMVLPSSSEGLANAWVEALACGCPLVVSDAGGAREVVTRPEAGRIVVREAEAIAGAVHELLADPPPREAVAECTSRFSWEANAEALAGYYERLLTRP